MRGYSYTYAVVSDNGAGKYSVHKSLPKARAALAPTAQCWPGIVFEIERIQQYPFGRTFQVREGNKWVEWDPARDHNARKPDWVAVRDSDSEGESDG